MATAPSAPAIPKLIHHDERSRIAKSESSFNVQFMGYLAPPWATWTREYRGHFIGWPRTAHPAPDGLQYAARAGQGAFARTAP